MNNTNNTNNTNKMNKLFLINKNKSNIESTVYKFKDVGSFGVVVYDDNNILYKILEITSNQDKNQQDIIEKNNLVEIIILNSFSENKNIIQSISTFYYDNRIDKQLGTTIGVFQSNIYLKCPWIIRETSTLIFNRLKMYKGNLYSYINNTNLNLVRNNFASIAKQLIRGINNLHQKGLLHGDIKSDNILYNFELDEFNQIVVIDFGGVKPVHIKEYFKTCTIITRSPEDLKYETNPDFDYFLSRGCISLYELNETKATRYGKIILEPFHMSYPYVFEYQSKFYMVPETSQNKDIRLYEAEEFPYKWKFLKTIFKDVDAADTTIFEKDGLWWLFTNIDPVKSGEHDSELFIFYSDNPLSDKWTSHPKNPVICNPLTGRMGGIIFDNKLIYRVSQKQAFKLQNVVEYFL
jgi:serine/threonine protein kinase